MTTQPATGLDVATQLSTQEIAEFPAQGRVEAWRRPFVPRAFLSNGHLMTIAGNFLPRRLELPPPERTLVEVEASAEGRPCSQVLCDCHWQKDAADRLTVLLLHGLEGSSESQYILGNADKAWHAGCNVIRMNMRNCGGTEQLSPTLYHSGLSQDIRAVLVHFIRVRGLNSVAAAGYSMGGNLVLKFAGEAGAGATTDPLPELKAVAAVSPAADLAASADALSERRNHIYQSRFIKGLMQRYRRKAELFPELYTTRGLPRIRTIREFDEYITARHSGFTGADDYYDRASAARVVPDISVPALVLHADDDPFILLLPETRNAMHANPHVTLVETKHGGHCAFLEAPDRAAGYDGYWAERSLLAFLLHANREVTRRQ